MPREKIVPSSTSNFDPLDRAPKSRWWLLPIFVVALVALVTAGEFFWRSHGWQPSVRDTKALWSLHRRVSRQPANKLILAGSSRILLGLSHRVIDEAWHVPIANLAVDGNCPLAVIEDLASDEHVHQGDVILLSTRMACLRRSALADAADVVAYEHNLPTAAPLLDEWLAARLESVLVARHPHIGLRRLAYVPFRPQLRDDDWVVDTFVTREITAFYERIDIAAYRANRLARDGAIAPITDDDIAEGKLRLAKALGKLAARGVRVALIRMPVDDDHWAIDEKIAPRQRYWDPIASRVEAVPIHFRDHKEMQGYRLPDSSHLDHAERDAFTKAFVGLLEQKGLRVNAARN